MVLVKYRSLHTRFSGTQTAESVLLRVPSLYATVVKRYSEVLARMTDLDSADCVERDSDLCDEISRVSGATR